MTSLQQWDTLHEIRRIQGTLTESSMSLAQNFFSSIPSSTASVSLYVPFRIKTRLPVRRETDELRCLFPTKEIGELKGEFTRSRNDSFQVILVKFQFVSRIDHLHHCREFILHFLQRKDTQMLGL